jgi:hypothetical protein
MVVVDGAIVRVVRCAGLVLLHVLVVERRGQIRPDLEEAGVATATATQVEDAVGQEHAVAGRHLALVGGEGQRALDEHRGIFFHTAGGREAGGKDGGERQAHGDPPDHRTV